MMPKVARGTHHNQLAYCLLYYRLKNSRKRINRTFNITEGETKAHL